MPEADSQPQPQPRPQPCHTQVLKEVYEARGGVLPDDVILTVKDRISGDSNLKKELKNVSEAFSSCARRGQG